MIQGCTNQIKAPEFTPESGRAKARWCGDAMDRAALHFNGPLRLKVITKFDTFLLNSSMLSTPRHRRGDRCTIFHDIGGENDWIIVKIRNMYSVSDRGCWQIGVKILPVDEAENLTGFPIMTKEVENENGSSVWVKCTTIWAKMLVLVIIGWT